MTHCPSHFVEENFTLCFIADQQGSACVKTHQFHFTCQHSVECIHTLVNPSSLWTEPTLICNATMLSKVTRQFYQIRCSASVAGVMT